MNWADFIIIGVIALSALIGIARGLIREVVSLAVWIGAVVLAWFFYRDLAFQLEPHISTEAIRLAVAFVIIVLVVLFLGAIVGWLLSLFVEKTGLTGTDRVLGVVFGAARGAVLVAMLVFLGTLTPVAEETWWQDSQLIGHFQALAEWILSLIPPELQEKLKSI